MQSHTGVSVLHAKIQIIHSKKKNIKHTFFVTNASNCYCHNQHSANSCNGSNNDDYKNKS